MKISRKEFAERCLKLRGTTFITLTYCKILDGNDLFKPVTNEIVGRIKKRTRLNVILNHDHANAVNKEREKVAVVNGEDEFTTFVAGKRAWGARIAGTPIVEHHGKFYLRTKINLVINTQYLLDGNPVEKSVIAHWLKPKGERDPAQPNDFKIENIELVAMQGEILELVN